ncbi:MAG TPA: SIS domain-containing protein [Tepidisphaeraceae bacterium]|nr:SIS domain-containing protein [Tepidisphaeraceae bacterium]
MTTISTAPNPPADVSVNNLAGKIRRQANEAAETKQQFFAAQAERIAECCRTMAKAFDQGGKLLVFGNGGSCCDALHMAVECTHPIIERRPALPAICLTTDIATLTAIGNDQDFSLAYVQQLRLLAKPGDMAMGMSTSGKSSNVNRALQAAKEMGLLTVGYAGRDGGRMPQHCDYCFVVSSFSIPRIQETQETLLHIMWDMIHVIRGEEDVL